MTRKTYTCHNCKRGPGRHCFSCSRVALYEKKLRHEPRGHVERIATAPSVGSTKATDLPDEIEDTLRLAFCACTELTPLECLMLLHVAKRGTPRNFPAFLRQSVALLKHRSNATRNAANKTWQRVIAKCPLLKSLATWKEDE